MNDLTITRINSAPTKVGRKLRAIGQSAVSVTCLLILFLMAAGPFLIAIILICS